MDRKISLRNGALAGGIVILYLLLFYFIQKERMLNFSIAWSSILIYLFFMYRSIAIQRESLGGKISFREAVSTAFLTFIIANVIYYAFHYYMMKSDPAMVEILRENTIAFYKKITSTVELEKLEKSFEGFDVNLSTILLSFARGAIGGFILSLPLAGFMRK